MYCIRSKNFSTNSSDRNYGDINFPILDREKHTSFMYETSDVSL